LGWLAHPAALSLALFPGDARASIYYVFGFLFMVFLILCLTCAEVTILLCYFHLCAEDYHWWWRAFLTSGCSALYMLLYGIIYYYTRSEFADPVSGTLYFGWTIVMALLMFVVTGTCAVARGLDRGAVLCRPRTDAPPWRAPCWGMRAGVQARWASWLACGSSARSTL